MSVETYVLVLSDGNELKEGERTILFSSKEKAQAEAVFHEGATLRRVLCPPLDKVKLKLIEHLAGNMCSFVMGANDGVYDANSMNAEGYSLGEMKQDAERLVTIFTELQREQGEGGAE